MSNQLVWVDIPVVDLDRAIVFYSAVLGGSVRRQGAPGAEIALLPHADHAASGCLYRAGPDNVPTRYGPLVYLGVPGRLREAVQAVAAHGGSVVQAEQSIGDHGWRAVVIDSEGNRIALHSPQR